MLNHFVNISSSEDEAMPEETLNAPGSTEFQAATFVLIGQCFAEPVNFGQPIMPEGFHTETGPVPYASTQTVLTSVS
jgi:hypothetical protein